LSRQDSREDVGSADEGRCHQEEKAGGEGEEAQTSRRVAEQKSRRGGADKSENEIW